MEEAVVGVDFQVGAEAVAGLDFDAPVAGFACVDVARASVDHAGCNQVVGFEIKEVGAYLQAVVEEALAVGQFVVPESFGLEAGVLRRIHVEFAQGGVAKSFADGGMEFGLGRKVEDESALGHELGAGLRMMVYARSGVEGEPVGCVLTDVEVAGQVVFRAVGQVGFKARSDHAVPGVSAEVLPVGAQGNGISFKETISLINRQACLQVVVQV